VTNPYQGIASPYADLYQRYNRNQDSDVGPTYQNPTLAGITRSAAAPAPAPRPFGSPTAGITGPNQYVGQPAAKPASPSDVNTVDITSKLPDYLQNIAGSLASLLKPPTLPIGTTAKETQSLINQNRLNVQGNTNTALEQARESLGRAGLEGGESGVADSALNQIIRTGQSNLAASNTDIINNLIQQRFQQNAAQQQLYQGQLGTLASLMGALYPSATFAQQFPYEQQQDALSLLQALYGNTINAGQSAWAPYMSATGSIYS